MYRFSMTRPLAVAFGLLAAACSMKSISHRSQLTTPSSLSLQQLQDTDYDKAQLTVTATDGSSKAVALQQDLPKGQSQISQTVKPGGYHIDLNYVKGSNKVLSTDFCSIADKKGQDVVLVPGPNKISIIVCTPDGKAVQDADVSIIPIKKVTGATAPAPSPGVNPTQDPAIARGAAIYSSQCSACHGPKGDIAMANGSSLQGSKCASCSSQDSLVAKISATMPAPGLCKDACASDVATYILKNLH